MRPRSGRMRLRFLLKSVGSWSLFRVFVGDGCALIYACCLGLCVGVLGGSTYGAASMSLGRARLDGESRYGEPLFSRLGEVAAGLRGRDIIVKGFSPMPNLSWAAYRSDAKSRCYCLRC